ncbi:MAG: PCRF domain-containing protein, partial [Clostridia bacterium]|nr:PCRF domain-containing protein [Clostridia bacterium]
MFENLAVFENRLEELNLKLYDPTVAADRDLYRELMKEHKEITPIVEKYRELKNAEASIEDALMLLDDPECDKELRQMASEELSEARKTVERTAEELKILLLPRDPNDEKNVIVEIRGGAGGEEAALFAYNLYRMYTMYAEKRGWKNLQKGGNLLVSGAYIASDMQSYEDKEFIQNYLHYTYRC